MGDAPAPSALGVRHQLETFLASLDADPDATGLPAYVQRELYDYLQCGILAHGFLRLGCDTCHKELLLPVSCHWRLSGATQPPARDAHPDAPPARGGRRGDAPWDRSLERGAAAQVGGCSGHGALPVLSVRGAADQRCHHAGRGNPEASAASHTRGRPAPHCSGACPPGSLRLLLRLTAPGGAAPSRSAGSWGPHRLGLGLRLRSPRTPPMGGEG
jgi:Transposase zinc-binding domain